MTCLHLALNDNMEVNFCCHPIREFRGIEFYEDCLYRGMLVMISPLMLSLERSSNYADHGLSVSCHYTDHGLTVKYLSSYKMI
jgi:hypothetical protein